MKALHGPVSAMVALSATLLLFEGCKRSQPAANAPKVAAVSAVEVRLNPAGPLVINTAVSEFHLTPRGYVQAFLLRNGQRFTLDDPGADAAGGSATIAGKRVRDFAFDLSKPTVTDVTGKLGALGRRIDVTGRSASAGLDETLSVEVYDDLTQLFPKDFQRVDCVRNDTLLDVNTIQNMLWEKITPLLPPPPPLSCMFPLFSGE